jgi:8-oxo-dGTP diphosphatase
MAESERIRCVAAIPYNDKGQILLQQRDNKPDIAFPGYWTTFGGVIETGETPEVALSRELLEEIELEPPMTLWKVFDNPVRRSTGELVLIEQYVFVGRLEVEASEIKLNEGQALGYFHLDDIDRLPIAFGFETLFKDFFASWDTLCT